MIVLSDVILQQSYRDCTKQYEEILHNPNLPLWDYVVLTASNEAQAQAYRAQISYRLKHQMLPERHTMRCCLIRTASVSEAAARL